MEISETLFERLGGRPGLLRLLHHFYADVRQHQLLGPIFERQIENWPEHIEKIADFWTQVTGGPSVYAGGMPARHIPLGLREEHFQSWLGLWDVNCRIWLSAGCAAELSAMARQIGRRLRQFCGVPQPAPFNPESARFRSGLKLQP
ncbi:MAG TPA: group III truncated hemoglobin [Verrucomicrobiae bacterium]|nr:group III truncated hemoglobin [Verrucomicrobiae bacterium]